MAYDIQHIEDLRRRAVLANLQGTDTSLFYDDAACLAAYNGIGADFLPADIRKRLTKYLSLFEPAALIHDLDYSISDGTVKPWHDANDRFMENCLALADEEYSWFNPRRYLAHAAARVAYQFVDGFGGWRAWIEAFHNRQQEEKETAK